MRVTSSMLYSSINMNLQKQMEELYKYNEDISSQVRIHKPSDDPYALALSLKYDSSLTENNQWIENMENGKKWLGFTTDILDHSHDVAEKIYNLAIQGDNDSLTAENRESIATEVNGKLEELLKLANSSYLDKQIFNGDATNAPPFLGIRDDSGKLVGVAQFSHFKGGNPDHPIYLRFEDKGLGDPNTLDGVYYTKNGSIDHQTADDPNLGKKTISGEINRRTKEDKYINIAINGGSVYQPSGANNDTDIFQVVIDLREGLQTNNTDQIGNQIHKIQDCMDQISSQNAKAGTLYSRLEIAQQIMTTDDINLTEALSNIEDTDVSKAMMEYTRLEAAYTMSLNIGAKIMQTSLVNYI